MHKTTGNPSHLSNGSREVPDHVIQLLACCALPLMQAFYEREEVHRKFSEWKEKREQAMKCK